MTIKIIVQDEPIDLIMQCECPTFEMAAEELGKMERLYARKVQMELDKGDVIAEAQKEERF